MLHLTISEDFPCQRLFSANTFQVTQDFFNKYINNKWPKYLTKNKKIEAEAYLFGPLFPLNEYQEFTSAWNDGGMMGLWLVLQDESKKKKKILDQYDDDHFKKFKEYKFSRNKKVLQKIVKECRDYGLLFFGNTVGGDVGASLMIHVDPETKLIDSFVIDVDYFERIPIEFGTYKPETKSNIKIGSDFYFDLIKNIKVSENHIYFGSKQHKKYKKILENHKISENFITLWDMNEYNENPSFGFAEIFSSKTEKKIKKKEIIDIALLQKNKEIIKKLNRYGILNIFKIKNSFSSYSISIHRSKKGFIDGIMIHFQ